MGLDFCFFLCGGNKEKGRTRLVIGTEGHSESSISVELLGSVLFQLSLLIFTG